jgi:hypothetical protein
MKPPQNQRQIEIGEGSFAAGTRIALSTELPGNAAAEVPIEELKPGDSVAVLGGEVQSRLVQSLTPRRVDHTAHAQPALVTPVRLRASALGLDVPRRDLLLPAEALVLIRDLDSPALVPAGALLNGTSITRAPPATALAWYALELGAHDVVVAENLPVASARGQRADEPDHRQTRCARLLVPGPELAALRSRLAAPAEESAPLTEPEAPGDGRPLRLIVDGREVPPVEEPVGGEYQFLLPEGAGAVRLASPARASPAPRDPRRLGVAVTRLELDGVQLSLDGGETGRGFHPVEGDQKMHWRWTDGNAWLVLPHSAAVRRLAISITDWYKNLRI